MDPWDELYQFHIGPWRNNWYGLGYMPFRSYRVDENIPGAPNNVSADADGDPYDYPAPDDLPVYIWSNGGDIICGQRVFGTASGFSDELDQYLDGGGDDINSWDSSASWQEHYR